MLRAVIRPTAGSEVLARGAALRDRRLDLRGARPRRRERGSGATARSGCRTRCCRPTAGRCSRSAPRCSTADRVRLHFSIDAADRRRLELPAPLPRAGAALYDDPEAALPPLELSFRDYVLAEAGAAETPRATQRSREYWLERLADAAAGAPSCRWPASPASLRAAALRAPDGPARARAAGSASRRARPQAGLTPPAVLLAAFAEVLAAWSKSPRFTLNLTLFNRLPLHPQVDELVGDFTSLTLLAVDHARRGAVRDAGPARSRSSSGRTSTTATSAACGCCASWPAATGAAGRGHAGRLHQHPRRSPAVEAEDAGLRAAGRARSTASARRRRCGSTTRSSSRTAR